MRSRLIGHLAAGAALAGLLALGADTGFASAAMGGATSNLQCFSGTASVTGFGGTCMITSKTGGTATLSNNSSSAKGAYSGVLNAHRKNMTGAPLGKIAKFGYTWTAMTSSTPTPMPTDLSLNVGISTMGGTAYTTFVFIDAYYCPGTSRPPNSGATTGTVTVVNDTTCGMYFENTFYPNWAALMAAYPDATIGTTSTALPFIVAERVGGAPPAVWGISNVHFGSLGGRSKVG